MTPAGFRFRAGDRVVSMPLTGTELRLGGASDRLVFLTNPACPGWSLYTADRSIVSDPVIAGCAEFAPALARMRGKRALSWAVFAALALAIVGLPLLAVLNIGWLAGLAARQVPVEWEQQLGATAFAQYRIRAQLLDDEGARAHLDALTRTLTAAVADDGYVFTFHIANDPTLNAFALPGGTIVIHTGLILRAESAEELLGVLAHEISHVTQRHGLRSVITSAGIVVIAQALLGDVSGLLAVVAGAAPFLLTMRYSRSFEEEADDEGFLLLTRAQIDPAGLATFFQKVKDEERKMRDKVREATGQETADLMEGVSGFISTHPATDARIAHLRERAQDADGPYRKLDAEFARLQEDVRAFVAKNPKGEDDESKN